MKKIIFSIFTIVIITIFSTSLIAAENTNPSEMVNNESIVQTTDKNESLEELTGASKEIIDSITEKDRKISELSDKYNDKTLGTVAYYLDRVRFYSTPIFFIFLTIGAFNFFIIGNKKLDKKEQGFGWITACIIGWVVFQCIPLVFALFAM